MDREAGPRVAPGRAGAALSPDPTFSEKVIGRPVSLGCGERNAILGLEDPSRPTSCWLLPYGKLDPGVERGGLTRGPPLTQLPTLLSPPSMYAHS